MKTKTRARALGVPALRSKVLVVAISAGLAGVGGGYSGLMQGSLFPDSRHGHPDVNRDPDRSDHRRASAPRLVPIVGAFFVVPLMEFSNVLGQRIGFYGLNTLIYGIVILAVIAFLPGRHLAANSAAGKIFGRGLMLAVRGLTKRFRGLLAVSDVSFEVRPGEIVALIGPNGAGKTTCFNMIAGALAPTSGCVLLDGKDITGLAPERIALRGLVRTFQIVRPMSGMTVLENAMVGALAHTPDVCAAAEGRPAAISRVGLAEKSDAPASAPHAAGSQDARAGARARRRPARAPARRGDGGIATRGR